jgi:tRNA nucleotidyltransferase/poly(A) polymerase
MSSRSATLSAIAELPALKAITGMLGEKGQPHLVGGAVRDAILGLGSEDLDVATALSPQEVLERASRAGMRTVETGIAHGTVLCVIDGVHVEVTSYRSPSDRTVHRPGRSIEEDLNGRDFTINALAYDLLTQKLVDPFRGEDDLRSGILRGVGDAEARFREDPLRILRMVRFGPAAGRTIAAETYAAAGPLTPLLSGVAVERIKNELDRMILLDAVAAFRELYRLGILAKLFPEVEAMVGFEQNEFHIHDVYEHTMWVLGRTPPDRILRWSAFFHDFGKPPSLSIDDAGRRHFYGHEIFSAEIAERRLRALKFSNTEIESICRVVRHHMRPVDCGPSGIRRILRDLGDDLPVWHALKYADAPPKASIEEISSAMQRFDEMVEVEKERSAGLGLKRLVIDGNDLIQLGIPAGPKMGRILRAIDERVIEDPELNSRESLLALAKKLDGELV